MDLDNILCMQFCDCVDRESRKEDMGSTMCICGILFQAVCFSLFGLNVLASQFIASSLPFGYAVGKLTRQMDSAGSSISAGQMDSAGVFVTATPINSPRSAGMYVAAHPKYCLPPSILCFIASAISSLTIYLHVVRNLRIKGEMYMLEQAREGGPSVNSVSGSACNETQKGVKTVIGNGGIPEELLALTKQMAMPGGGGRQTGDVEAGADMAGDGCATIPDLDALDAQIAGASSLPKEYRPISSDFWRIYAFSSLGGLAFWLFLDLDVTFGYMTLCVIVTACGIFGYLGMPKDRPLGIHKDDKFKSRMSFGLSSEV